MQLSNSIPNELPSKSGRGSHSMLDKQTTDDDNDDVHRRWTKIKDESEEQNCPPPFSKRGTEIRGLIVPSQRQRQLMRQVSGLGLEDPVFVNNSDDDDDGDENIDRSTKLQHASNFFDDMDIHDVPEDMRDMISLASDRTDVIDEEVTGGEGNESTKTSSAYSVSACSVAGLRSSTSANTMPLPLGLDPGMEKITGSSTMSSTSDSNYVPLPGSFRSKIMPSKTKGKTKQYQHQTLNSTDVPPQGSFRIKTSRKERCNSYVSSTLLHDEVLAAQVDDMLSMNDSLACFGGSCTVAANSRRLNRPVPKRQDSRLSVCSSKYVPPQIPLSAGIPIQEESRFLPDSMEVIFSSKPSRIKKSKHHSK
mmetsp:Transcript_5027/g.5546  ORF Transcript_5027/g.5546 Transcript_5027/m.5546 type:complete len:363 (-) Transcript_5027:104-1192(-)